MKRNAANETNTNETATLFELNEMASNVLDFSTTLKELRKTVDPTLVRQRAGRRDRNGQTHMVEYVEWQTVADILDEHAPNWGHSIKDIRPIGDIITVTVAITIDGVTREGIGTGRVTSETGIKKAEHDALKRAAVKFGIARELYKREFDSIDGEEPISASVTAVAVGPVVSETEPRTFEDSVAKTLGDLVTPKQLGMIRSLAREGDIDAAKECMDIMKCSVAELSKRAASELIDHLQNMQRNGVLPMRLAS
ncbi:MAG: Rad52/Rad22 family DNA repair protein [Pyrinomonadaceae bacterium]